MGTHSLFPLTSQAQQLCSFLLYPQLFLWVTSPTPLLGPLEVHIFVFPPGPGSWVLTRQCSGLRQEYVETGVTTMENALALHWANLGSDLEKGWSFT